MRMRAPNICRTGCKTKHVGITPEPRETSMHGEAKSGRDTSLERRLVELAWTDHAFAELLQTNPRQALASIGVEVSPEVEVDVRQQRPDTLYFAIPPLAERIEDAEKVINQMDLWQGGELFCWIMPQALKLELLRMRESFRRNNP